MENNDSIIIKHESDRNKEFQPNPDLVKLIEQLKSLLEPIQLQQNQNFSVPKYPVVIIVGNPRTGTTLTSQLLAASGNFAYPTNFLTRFAYAPLLGAMIQQMLFNPQYDFHGELSDVQSSCDATSNIGKTTGAMGVNEFFHFWRKFFPNYDSQFLNPEELFKVNINRMRSELAAIESVFNKPFVSKGKMLQFNIRHFAKAMPELFFIHVKRNPRFILQSVLLARRKFYGTDCLWFSVRPKEYEWLKDLDPIHQIAGQVFFTEKAIDEELAEIEDTRKLICTYEDICDNPKGMYDQLRTKLTHRGCDLPKDSISPPLTSGNFLKIDEEELSRLELAYDEIKSGESQ